MSVPVTFEEFKEEVFPVVVRRVDSKTIEQDLYRLRMAIGRMVEKNPCEALAVVNVVSRIIGCPI